MKINSLFRLPFTFTLDGFIIITAGLRDCAKKKIKISGDERKKLAKSRRDSVDRIFEASLRLSRQFGNYILICFDDLNQSEPDRPLRVVFFVKSPGLENSHGLSSETLNGNSL